MTRVSYMCMDILEAKPDFPDFAFVLFENGYLTHHIITGRTKGILLGMPGYGVTRDNFAPKAVPFNRSFVDKVFDCMEILSERMGGTLKADEMAVIPFESRTKEVLAFGNLIDTRTYEDGVILNVVNYEYGKPGKKLKVYSPPNATLIRLDLKK